MSLQESQHAIAICNFTDCSRWWRESQFLGGIFMAQETALTVTFNLNYDVRIIKIGEEFWFAAIDVCKILDLSNPTKVLKNLDDDEKQIINLKEYPNYWLGYSRSRGNPNVNFVNESGLYNLIFQSRKPEAKKFKRWVFHDVLPQIRKTGSYSVGDSEGEEKPTPEYIPFEEGLPLLRQITADHPEWSWDLKDTKVRIDENGMIHHVLCFNMKIDD